MGDPSNLVFGWRTSMMIMLCLPLLICVVALLLKKVEVVACRFLALFFLLCAWSNGSHIIGFAGFYDVWPGLTFFPFNVKLWLGALFYLHAYSLLHSQPLGWRKYLLLPGIVQSLYYLWAFTSLGHYTDKWAYNNQFHEPYIVPVETALGIVLTLFAAWSVWRWRTRYKAYLINTQSTAEQFDPIWLTKMIIAFATAGAVFVAIEAVGLFVHIPYRTAFPFAVVITGIMVWLAIESVWRLSDGFPKFQLPSQTANDAASTKPDELQVIIEKAQAMQQKVIHEKWYLEPRFSLTDLARRMGTNELYVSKYINQGLQVSFNDFINAMRIEDAKHALLHSSESILAVALESGFNSKATFNRVFKLHCQQTPSQYRQQQNKVSNHKKVA